MSEPALFKATVAGRRDVALGTCSLELEAPAAGSAPEPGQFYLLDCDGGREHLLRRPLAVSGCNPRDNGFLGLEFIVEVAGWGTGRLCALDAGDTVGVLGPLGRGFDSVEGRSLLVAGGIGLAPLMFLARRLDEEGLEYDMMAGFKDGEHYIDNVSALGGGVLVLTEDGTVGTRGMASDRVEPMLADGDYARVAACGPEAMMAAVAAVAEPAGVPCEVSLVARMACGLGACRGCVRTGVSGNLCVCTEGPVFDSRDVVWRTQWDASSQKD